MKITCYRCGVVGYFHLSRHARKAGWRRTNDGWLCPDCGEDGSEGHSEEPEEILPGVRA